MSNSVCRWGFLGTAAIARKNWKAVRLSGNGRVTAVASRSVAKAQRFIDECAAETPQIAGAAAVGAYEELLARDDVDAVYIPLPTGIRKQWVLAAAQAGKHVMCEKPLAMNSAESAELVELAKSKELASGVCYNIRYNQLNIESRDMVRRGDVATIFHDNGSYLQHWLY